MLILYLGTYELLVFLAGLYRLYPIWSNSRVFSPKNGH